MRNRIAALLLLSLFALAGCASRPSASAPASPTAPVAVALGVDLHDEHCLAACPRGAAASDIVVHRVLYTLANNGETKFADWVAYVVRPEWIGSDRPRRWLEDPDLPPAQTLERLDYNGVGATAYERGHQAPLQSFGASPDWPQTNYLSNITPQNGNLNGGRWRDVEAAERRLAQSLGGPVYVLTGPLYDDPTPMPPLPGADEPYRVPTGYWKVIAVPDGRAVGFIFANQAAQGVPYCTARRPISEIETRSHLVLLGGSSGSRPRLDAAIGCAN
jgi:endonuclease G